MSSFVGKGTDVTKAIWNFMEISYLRPNEITIAIMVRNEYVLKSNVSLLLSLDRTTLLRSILQIGQRCNLISLEILYPT